MQLPWLPGASAHHPQDGCAAHSEQLLNPAHCVKHSFVSSPSRQPPAGGGGHPLIAAAMAQLSATLASVKVNFMGVPRLHAASSAVPLVFRNVGYYWAAYRVGQSIRTRPRNPKIPQPTAASLNSSRLFV
jgi:hypothetical protein